jgi:hypothetical protein
MVISKCIDADAAEQIEVAIAFFVDDVNALTADEEDGVAVVGRKQKLRFRGANLIEFGQFEISFRSRKRQIVIEQQLAFVERFLRG